MDHMVRNPGAPNGGGGGPAEASQGLQEAVPPRLRLKQALGEPGGPWDWGAVHGERGEDISGQDGRAQSEGGRPPFPHIVRVAMVSAEVRAELGCAVIPATAPPPHLPGGPP